MKAVTCGLGCVVVLAGITGLASAQSVISAKSGLINYTEGQVLLDGKEVQLKFGNFPQIKEKSLLTTQDGRAEVLLSPGVFLRLGENSAVRLLSDRLTDNRLEFVNGSILVEAADLLKDQTIAITYQNANISLLHNGLYRVDSEPAQLWVYDGEAQVEQGGQSQVVKKARRLPLNGVSVAEKFDSKTGDALYRWAKRRAEYLAVANVSAAGYAQSNGYSLTGSSWIWNPYYGMYTFLPMSGISRSFWGYSFWSPSNVWMVYAPPSSSGGGWRHGGGSYDSGRGYSTVPHTASGTSGVVAASAPTAASSSSSAPISRGTGASDSGGHRR